MSLEEFCKIRYDNGDVWQQLKKDFAVVERYEVRGDVPVKLILELDRVAYDGKTGAFDYFKLYGDDRKRIKALVKGGNAAVMIVDGNISFAHSKVNEDGTLDNFGFTYVTGDGIERDENGNVIDKMEPSASTIYELLNDPELTHKGEALAWFGAVFICILNVLSILFADELFRWNLLFQIRNVENAEPSDWEIAGRYISWTVMTIMSLVIFITGLQ